MRVARVVLIALGLSLLTGLVIGTAIRLRLERSERYIGSAIAPAPLHVGHAGPAILQPGDRKEQVREPIDVGAQV